MATKPFHHERRQSPRRVVGHAAKLHLNGWSRLVVEVSNLSRGGFSARADALPRTDSYVTLEIPGIGRVEARVVWRGEERFGAKFVRPIDVRLSEWTREPSPASRFPEEVEEVARLLASRAMRAGPGDDEEGSR